MHPNKSIFSSLEIGNYNFIYKILIYILKYIYKIYINSFIYKRACIFKLRKSKNNFKLEPLMHRPTGNILLISIFQRVGCTVYLCIYSFKRGDSLDGAIVHYTSLLDLALLLMRIYALSRELQQNVSQAIISH